MTKHKLTIFDIDGTLCNRDETELLPRRKEMLDELNLDGRQIAIATNQGGVGYRLFRQSRNKTFEVYPTEQDVLERMAAIIENIGRPVPLNIAFSYYVEWAKSWSPIPEGREAEPYWRTDFRKPGGGMLLDHMHALNVPPSQTIYVGDRPEDEGAAQAAGCDFAWAWDYFGDPKEPEKRD